MGKRIRVVFVCTGNICRSPMAEAVFAHLVDQADLSDHFDISSAGTHGWHVGERPHRGTQQVLRKHNIILERNKRANKYNLRDYDLYDYILAMDEENLRNMGPNEGRRIKRLLEYSPPGTRLDVPDPYYENNFDEVFELVMEGSQGLLEYIKDHEDI